MNLTAERWAVVRRVYERALELPSDQRTAYLDEACGADRDLRREVDSLLRAQDRVADFLSRPVVDLQANPELVLHQRDRSGETLGAYRLEALIGRGGMGEIYRAVRVDGQFDRQVAIKLIRGGAAARQILEHFRRERQILASLEHAHIAQLYDAGVTADGIPYLVMEFVDGSPIDRYVDAQNLDLRAMLRLFLDVCDTVQFAHQRLIVHRDLKPANILVTANGEVKLLDFGIAKVLDSPGRIELTQTMLMTPAYASPEQIRGEAITTVSDVYSLGVLLYKLLAGRSPYGKDTTNSHSLAIEICEREPPSFVAARQQDPNAKRWAVARDLELITRMALRKLPSERYASVEQLAADIRRYLDGAPVLAAKGSALYRLRKFLVRNRVAVGATVAAMILASAGVWEIVRQRQIAERRFDDVRQLTNTVIFDVHDSIAELPGATPARKLILDRAMDYLSRLEKDSNSSLDLQREIASAYEKIGNTQGYVGASHLGEFKGAEASYRKNLVLRESIARRNPQNLGDAIALARANRLLAQFKSYADGNVTPALRYGLAGLSVAEKLVLTSPNDAKVLTELVACLEFLGEIYGGNGTGSNYGDLPTALTMYSKADRYNQRLRTMSPESKDTLEQSAYIAVLMGEVLHKQGNWREALRRTQAGRKLWKELATKYSDVFYKRNLVVTDERVAELMLLGGDARAALETLEKSLILAKELSAADPKNVDLREQVILHEASRGHILSHLDRATEAVHLLQNAASDYHSLGQATGSASTLAIAALVSNWAARALEMIGNFDESRRELTRAFDIYSHAAKTDGRNLEAVVNKMMVQVLLGNLALKMNDHEGAALLHGAVLQDATPLQSANPSYLELEYLLAETYAGMGDGVAFRAARSEDRQTKRNLTIEAIAWYEKSAMRWNAIPNPGLQTINYIDIRNSSADVNRKILQLRSHPDTSRDDAVARQ